MKEQIQSRTKKMALEMIEESEVIKDLGLQINDSKNQQSQISHLKSEVNELISIFVASLKTVKNRLNQKSSVPNQKYKI